MSQRWRITTAVATYLVLATMIVGAGTVGAQSPREVEVAPTSDFEETGQIAVRLTGLDEFEGGTAAVYLCGNADADAEPITATAGDCFAPGDDGYAFGTIENGSFETVYELRAEGIGANEATCQIPEGNQASCQLVVATSLDGDAKITGVPMDALLVQLTTADLVEADAIPEEDPDAEVLGTTSIQEEQLAVTGLSQDATLVMLVAAALLVYVGYLFWSAAAPARALQPARHAR